MARYKYEQSGMTAYEKVMARVEVNPESGCVEWQGSCDSGGYGKLGSEGKKVLCHRVVYTHHHGPIPAGLVVRHKCDNPRCVNIDHLEIGTIADNMRDMMERGRHRFGRPKGEVNGSAKLTLDRLRLIFELRYVAGLSQSAIGTLVGVGQTQIQRILRGEKWTDETVDLRAEFADTPEPKCKPGPRAKR